MTGKNPESSVIYIFMDVPLFFRPSLFFKFISDLATGKVNLFKGPLNYQDGKPFVKAGQPAGDKQIWYMEQLLQGMDGESSVK